MRNDKTLKIAFTSLIINFAYCIYNGYIGVSSRSWWFITLCAYYVVLSMMRFTVLLSSRRNVKDGISPKFLMRFCGVLLVILSVTLAGTTYLSTTSDFALKHGEIVMITLALYAFSKVTISIINYVKATKIDSGILKTLRCISFADAFVSIFSLQRSMLVSFEGMSKGEIYLLNGLTGSAVYILVFILGLNLIGGERFNMAKSKFVNANKKIADSVVSGYKKIEEGVVDGYKKIENGVVKGYTKIEDKFVEQYLTHDGETVEEAKKRLKNK